MLLNMKEAGSRGKFNAESKKRMSEAASRRVVPKETIERLKYYCNNRTKESRLKVSIKHQGNKYRLGIPHTGETLLKMSQASKRYMYNILCPNGCYESTDCLAHFCSKNKLTPQLLGNTFRGTYSNGNVSNHHKGYKIVSKENILK